MLGLDTHRVAEHVWLASHPPVSQRIVLLVSFVTTNKRNEQQGLSALSKSLPAVRSRLNCSPICS